MPARNGIGRSFGTFFKHASTFDKVFGVGHCGTSLRTNSPDHMALDFVPCRSPPAQIIVWRMLRLKAIGQGLAPSGEEAVTLLKRHIGKYRALVTDINLLGRIDGWEVAKQARQLDPAFPIIYMTGAAADEWAIAWRSKQLPFDQAIRASTTGHRRSQLLNSEPPTTA